MFLEQTAAILRIRIYFNDINIKVCCYVHLYNKYKKKVVTYNKSKDTETVLNKTSVFSAKKTPF